MEIYVIGTIGSPKKPRGHRLLFIDNGKQEYRDVPTNVVINMVKKNPQLYKNVTVNKFSKLKGVGGVLERYGVVGKTNALVILRELVDDNGNTLGYKCADITGKIANVQKAIMPRQVKKVPLANGKLITRDDGTEFISPIEGEYTKLVTTPPQQKNHATQNSQNKQDQSSATPVDNSKSVQSNQTAQTGAQTNKGDTVFGNKLNEMYLKACKEDIFKIIDGLKMFKRYDISPSVQQVVKAVEHQKMAYPTQRSILARTYVNWINTREPLKDDIKPASSTNTQNATGGQTITGGQNTVKPATQTSQTTQGSQTTTKNTNTVPVKSSDVVNNKTADQGRKEVVNNVSKASETTKQQTVSGDILKYKVHDNGTAYVSGVDLQKLQPDARGMYRVSIQVPDFMLDGKSKRPVVGISQSVFSDKRIRVEAFQAGSNMRDIAQGVFSGQPLVTLDLSKTKISFVQSMMCEGCRQLTTVLLPSTVERIHEQAFESCVYLDNVELPDSCDTIARNAFASCRSLKHIKSKASYIQDKAFVDCDSLEDFDFTYVNDIGSCAFMNTGFSELHIPGNVRTLGTKQFSFCRRLKTVVVDEGTTKIGEYCFYKPKPSDYRLHTKYRHYTDVVQLSDVTQPKSVIEISNGAFKNVLNVNCYVGTPTESFCKAFQIPYTLLDYVNDKNQQTVRRRSFILQQSDGDLVERLYKKLTTPAPGVSNPDYKLDTQKLHHQPVTQLSDEQLKLFKFNVQDNKVEPNILFKSYVNYLTKVCENTDLPFYAVVKEFYQACYIDQVALYNDGYNAVYKVQVRVKDSLEDSMFIVVLEGKNRQYVADCTMASDVVIGKGRQDDQELPISQYLHAGDKLGLQQTISGVSAEVVIQGGGYQRVGKIFLDRLNDYSYKVRVSRDTYYLVIPSKDDKVLKIHDTCKYEIDPRTKKPRMVQNQEEPYIVIVDILTRDAFLKEILNNKKVQTSGKLDMLERVRRTKSEVLQQRIESTKHIAVEKESYLHQIGLKFKNSIETDGTVIQTMKAEGLTPNCLTQEELEGLFRSYWMVPKDIPWRNRVGQKQLNKLNEYTIGNYKVIEYRSNMIVKFSNPYMNGVKNAFIFDIYKGGKLVKVMASRYNLQYITSKLYDMSHYSLNKYGLTSTPVLMQDPNKIDEVPADLFYDFYPVLNSKNGWDIQKYVRFKQYLQRLYINDFYISMYKPTGVFYLVQYSYVLQQESVNQSDDKKKTEMRNRDRKATIVAHPLFPIGQMDRALIVAATTNINARNIGILDELMAVSVVTCNMHRMYSKTGYIEPNSKQVQIYNNYIEARRLLIQGVDDVEQYSKLVNDRAIYMMGLVHHGKLEAEQPLDYDEDDGLLPEEPKSKKTSDKVKRTRRKKKEEAVDDSEVLDLDGIDLSDLDEELGDIDLAGLDKELENIDIEEEAKPQEETQEESESKESESEDLDDLDIDLSDEELEGLLDDVDLSDLEDNDEDTAASTQSEPSDTQKNDKSQEQSSNNDDLDIDDIFQDDSLL